MVGTSSYQDTRWIRPGLLAWPSYIAHSFKEVVPLWLVFVRSWWKAGCSQGACLIWKRDFMYVLYSCRNTYIHISHIYTDLLCTAFFINISPRLRIHMVKLLFFIRVVSLAQRQSYDCHSAKEVTLKGIDKHLKYYYKQIACAVHNSCHALVICKPVTIRALNKQT